MAISEAKCQEWRVIFTQRSKASDILTSTLAAFLFSTHPKREMDREGHLNYDSAYNRGRQLSHHKTKLIKCRPCRADLQSLHGFRFYYNIAPNAICQRVFVLTLRLV